MYGVTETAGGKTVRKIPKKQRDTISKIGGAGAALALLSIVILLVAAALSGCSGGGGLSLKGYSLDASIYIQGDTAFCISAAVVDTSSGLRLGLAPACFTFRKGNPAAEPEDESLGATEHSERGIFFLEPPEESGGFPAGNYIVPLQTDSGSGSDSVSSTPEKGPTGGI